MNSETTIEDMRVEFFITNPDNIFNKLMESVTRNTYTYEPKIITRRDVKQSFGCKNTQFLFVSLCYIYNSYVDELILNYRNIGKKSEYFENILQGIGRDYSKLFDKLRPSPNPIKNGIAQFDELTELTNIHQLKYNLFLDKSVFDTENYVICPLCLYTKSADSTVNRHIIQHYFTLIYNKGNNKYYINSSYGVEDQIGHIQICIMNYTNEIQEEELEYIINVFNNGINENDEQLYNYVVGFIKYYFLPGVPEELFDIQMNIIKQSKIGKFNRYFNILDETMRTMHGGKKKYKRHSKKYKMRSKSKRRTFKKKTFRKR
jgi:hypothetical protein